MRCSRTSQYALQGAVRRIALCTGILLFAGCSSTPKGLSVGNSLAAKGQCEEATEAYAQAIEDDPLLIDAYLGRGACFAELERWDESATSYSAALELETSERTLKPLAGVRQKQGEYDRADALVVQLVDLAESDPDRLAYQRQLAALRMAAGNEREAVTVLRDVLKAQPEDNQNRIELGRALVATRQYEEAIRVLSEALAVARDRDEVEAPLICEIGRAMEAIDRFEDALRSYRWCGSLDDASIDGAIGEGRLLRKSGELEAAIEKLRGVTSSFPDSAAAHYELGLALRDFGIFDQAVTELENAADLDNGMVEVYVPLLDLLAKRVPDPKRRYAVLGRAAGALDEDFSVQLEYGRAATRRRDFEPAHSALQRAIALTPDNAEANFYLGVVQAATGDLDEATATVEALGVLNPEQALELSEIVNETRKGGDPVQMLPADPESEAEVVPKRGRKKRGAKRARGKKRRGKRGKKKR